MIKQHHFKVKPLNQLKKESIVAKITSFQHTFCITWIRFLIFGASLLTVWHLAACGVRGLIQGICTFGGQEKMYIIQQPYS